ncbi:MAG: four helix bundle protein [bacterium]
MFNFEKLEVWQKSVKFTNMVYEITEKFSKDEVFGVTMQLRRASASIALNIAEGSGRKSRKEFAHFLSLSYGSICEVITLLKIGLARNYISQQTYELMYKECEDIARMISGLSTSLNTKH